MGLRDNALIVGSGPNGLTAGIILAAHGVETRILETRDKPGGNTQTNELTLPGFLNDHCSGVHPMGILSPIFKTLQLEQHGLRWRHAAISAAHPLDNQPAALLTKSVNDTANGLGADAQRYAKLIAPLLRQFDSILEDVLTPPAFDKSFLPLARFGIKALLPATLLAKLAFKDERAKALLAGCAAHSILPLDMLGTSAVGLIFLLSGHATDWPVAEGGSHSIARALVNKLESLGGIIEYNRHVDEASDLPDSKVCLFDLSPQQIRAICSNQLPTRYLNRLRNYRYGPAAFKIDYALKERIPWNDPNCALASTVHVGGNLNEIAASERAAWDGSISGKPFVMVCQQSHFDPTRAPKGKHTGYAYCHVPFGSDVDFTEAIEKQIERFAPGFKDCILSRHIMNPFKLSNDNPANIGGTITGGAATLSQLLFRPVAKLDPYAMPNPRFFICSHATPPGGGVHGMCGYNAARSVLKRLGIRFRAEALRAACSTPLTNNG